MATAAEGCTASRKRPHSDTENGLLFPGDTFYVNRVDGENVEEFNISFPDLFLSKDGKDIRDRVTAFLISGCQVSADWLVDKLRGLPPAAPVTVVHHDETLSQSERDFLTGQMGWELVVRPARGLMHAKMALIRFQDDFVRFMVTSANVLCQWEHDREVVWVQDFPINKSGRIVSTCPFETRLRRFLRGVDVLPERVDEILGSEGTAFRADFNGVKVELLANCRQRRVMDGEHPGGGFRPDFNGHNALGEILKHHVWPVEAREAPIVCMQGSLGRLTPDFLRGFRDSATGQWQHLGRNGGRAGYKPTEHEENNCPPFKIVHPTNGAVYRGSQKFLNSVCFQAEWYAEEEFPRHCMYEYVANPVLLSGNKPPMNHAKVVVRAVPPELDDTLRRAWMRGPNRGKDTRLRCWVYIGSANFSKAAWGMTKKSSSNTELGVVLTTYKPHIRDKWLKRLPAVLPPISLATAHDDDVQVVNDTSVAPRYTDLAINGHTLNLGHPERPFTFGFSLYTRGENGEHVLHPSYIHRRREYLRKMGWPDEEVDDPKDTQDLEVTAKEFARIEGMRDVEDLALEGAEAVSRDAEELEAVERKAEAERRSRRGRGCMAENGCIDQVADASGGASTRGVKVEAPCKRPKVECVSIDSDAEELIAVDVKAEIGSSGRDTGVTGAWTEQVKMEDQSTRLNVQCASREATVAEAATVPTQKPPNHEIVEISDDEQ